MAQARQFLYPSGDRQKLVYLATEIFGTPHRAASSQLFTRQEVVGPSDLSGDPEPPSSLQPLATSQQKWRGLDPLQMWRFLPVLWEGPVLPTLGVWWREKEVRQSVPPAASHRTGVLSPSPVK